MDTSDKRNVRRLRQIGCLHERCWSRPSDFRDSRGRTECSQTAQEELAHLLRKDGVGNLEVAVGWATVAGCLAGTVKLFRWGVADWANEGH